MSTKHTPTPWIVGQIKPDEPGWLQGHVEIVANIPGARRAMPIATVKDGCGFSDINYEIHQFKLPHEVNAAHIVKCVNLHDELVSALESSTCTCIMKQDLDSYSDGKQLWQVDKECKRCATLKRAKSEAV